jgi:hypothetical protein
MSIAIQYSPEVKKRRTVEQNNTELLKALDTFISASPALCVDRERRRNVSVQYIVSWGTETHFTHCVEKMVTDEFTDWEVRLRFSVSAYGLQNHPVGTRLVFARDYCKKLGGRIKLVVELLDWSFTPRRAKCMRFRRYLRHEFYTRRSY